MSTQTVIVSLVLGVLFLAVSATIFQYLSTKRLMSIIELEHDSEFEVRDVMTGKQTIASIREARYKCCDHCGLNFAAVGQSICEREPDCHTFPCNEPGFCKGKEVAL